MIYFFHDFLEKVSIKFFPKGGPFDVKIANKFILDFTKSNLFFKKWLL